MVSNDFFKIERPDFFIYSAFLFFFMDCLVNYFYQMPIFVVSIPLLILISIFTIKGKNNKSYTFFIFFIFTLSFIFNLFRFGLEKDSITDYLFVSLCIFSIGCALSGAPKYKTLRNITLMCILFFIPSFFGINGSGFGDTDVFNSGSDDLEYLRVYNQGLYRLPHVASYLLTLSALWWVYIWYRNKKIKYFLFFLISLLCCLYTGSRTPIVAVILSLFFIYFSLKPIRFLIFFVFFSFSFFVLYKLDWILELFHGTFFYQYLSILKTLQTDYERLSRFIIWSSWYDAIKDFSLYDWFFGKGFSQSLDYNEENLGNRIWFHNDFLSIIYSYGLFSFFGYLSFLIYFVQKGVKSSSVLIAICAYFIFLTGFFNGFYKYMPIIFVYFTSYSLYRDKFLVRGNQ